MSGRQRWWGVASVVALLVLGVVAPASARPFTIEYVGQCVGDSPYSTIQSAVDAAAPGGGVDTVIVVCPAVYQEQVRIRQRPRLTISAPAGAVVDATQLFGPALTATDSPRLRVSGLTLRSTTSGAEITRSRAAKVQGMFFETGGDGLFLLDSPGSLIADNAIHYARGGLGLGLGLGVSRSDGTRVIQNTVEGGGTGFTAYETRGLRVVANSFDGRTIDVRDTTSGTGTAGTASTWLRNQCDTSDPVGLCTDPGA